MNSLRTTRTIMHRQRGAAMMIMLVIMIIGVITFLVGALSNSSLKSARDQQASDVLVQARDALIGRAVSDASHPGSLPCPDNSAPGSPLWGTAPGPIYGGGHCPSYIGRLPWKTLGIPELRDANGEDLWYALSPTLRDSNAAQPINSDTQGWLSLTGTITLNNVAAIVFAPGAAICGQSRTASATANQYLETLSTISTAGPTPITVRSASNDCSNLPYNDNLLAITTDQIFQQVEKRIVREVKACMDNYAATSASKYPWPASVVDLTYTSKNTTPATLFGRIPVNPATSTTTTTSATSSSDPNVVTLVNTLSSLQAAVNNCKSSDSHQSALTGAGNALLNALGNITNPPFTSTFINYAKSAGNAAVNTNACDYINNYPSSNTVQTKLTSANSALSGINITTVTPDDPSMQPSWPAGCFVPGTYWDDWENLVFYQVASGYQPMTLTPACGTSCLSIIGSANNAVGSGSYRAVVIVARKYISTDTAPRSSTTNTAAYLEPVNLVPQDSTTNVQPYNTFRPTDPNFQTVNDLAQCLDGFVNCK